MSAQQPRPSILRGMMTPAIFICGLPPHRRTYLRQHSLLENIMPCYFSTCSLEWLSMEILKCTLLFDMMDEPNIKLKGVRKFWSRISRLFRIEACMNTAVSRKFGVRFESNRHTAYPAQTQISCHIGNFYIQILWIPQQQYLPFH